MQAAKVLPLLRMSVTGLWNRYTARFSPCHSSPSPRHVPLDNVSSEDLDAPRKSQIPMVTHAKAREKFWH